MKNGRSKKKPPPMEVFNVKAPSELLMRLHRQAEKEERSAAYLVRVFIKAGLDDRQRGAR
jgi:predicted DNA-binding protein